MASVASRHLGVEPGVQPFLGGHEDRHAARGSAGDDADLGHHVVVVHQGALKDLDGNGVEAMGESIVDSYRFPSYDVLKNISSWL